MDSVDKKNCIGRLVGYHVIFFQYANTLFRSRVSQKIVNHIITSLKYTVLTPRLRQNEHNRAFSMLVAATRV